jgi:hypothetical protein
MYRLYKPARSKGINRGLFSYLTESVLNMVNFIILNGDGDIKYYHDLFDIPGYGNKNIFDISLIQDEKDFKINNNLYSNIESFQNILNLDCYDVEKYNQDIRSISEKIIEKFFIPNETLSTLLNKRHKQINFISTIGVHRRATDINQHHNIVNIETIFNQIESYEFDNVFLMCDNIYDTNKFKLRYGNRLITYDEFTSKDMNLPFFKINNSIEDINNHIMELLFGVFTLSKTKNFICSKSNISSFCVLSNSKLNYTLLNI